MNQEPGRVYFNREVEGFSDEKVVYDVTKPQNEDVTNKRAA